ncbi:HlyD family secretion protein [Rhodovibrio salinarum]|uniref:HlyD family secretion protein n=1 Tax=Rhodovibrio salinarum TaxID=1087 RepID=A0A934V072_9PROT|nr:HlyD family secretion protein [Rhodovibrio salinarum]MBK1697301.1 HlyD family secretion protein [Rhodovibrio salinarum]
MTQDTQPQTAPDTEQTGRDGASSSSSARKRRRRWVRPLLLLAGPLAVLVGGIAWYYTGGRYESTTNAYVHADMVAISPEVSGPIAEVKVDENEVVHKGDELFRIEQRPFKLAVARAEAELHSVRQDIRALKATYQEQKENLQLARIRRGFAQRDFDRKNKLSRTNVVSQAKLDEVQNALETARQQVAVSKQAMQATRAQLSGDPDLPVDQMPKVKSAQAALEKAQLDLAHTTVPAPFDGIASNTPEPGQYVGPSASVMSVVATRGVWVDANFKETALTHVAPGQAVDIRVDTYPGRVWHGTVASIAPATGSEFSVLPAQNVTGNWVKVVQRIPVRIAVETPRDAPQLRSGMSTEVEIDTRHRRELPAFARKALAWLGTFPETAMAKTPDQASKAAGGSAGQ